MPNNIKRMSPKPINTDEKYVPYNPRKILGLDVSEHSIVHGLFQVQKYSIAPMALYFPVHAVNTMITPLVNAEDAPESMLKTINQWVPSVASKVLIGSLVAHISSGVLLRGWKLYRRKELANKYHMDKQFTSQDKIGLNGGVSGFFFGLYKQFSVSPLSISGYVLTPLVLYHLLIMKWIPESMGEPVTGFDFVKQMLRASEWWIRWFAGIIPLTALISAASYHVVAGVCRLLNVSDLKKRKTASKVVSGLTIAGFLSVLRLSYSKSLSSDWSQFKHVFSKLRLL
ncbi:hypothetical protein RNJ44_00499 [Nakaseomyces bracarensis]|uniref:Mitochondrial adapter protein MCP1 transmembrane domain-containing protein n=1 Tax=Nakaseomyces bracarensis TaxID=273131 RepID=A0ABR4NT27_9SACH